jgi:arylsulfatase A-like enzyme
VSTLDVAPTLLALLDLPAPAEFQGRNLLRDPLPEDAPMFSLGAYGTERLEKDVGTQFGVRRGSLRYVVNTKDGTEELYDHASDPGETRNLAQPGRPEVPELRAGVAALVGERSRIAAPPPLSAEQEAALRALGYVE